MNPVYDFMPKGTEFEDLQTLTRLIQVVSQLKSQFGHIYNAMYENFEMVAGKVFSETDLARLRREKRPDFQRNYVKPTIKQLVGSYRLNMPGYQVFGKNPDDANMAEIMDKIVQHIIYTKNDLAYELSSQFAFGAIAKWGFNKVDWDGKQVTIRNVDPFRIMFDLGTRRRDLSDCGYICEQAMLSPDDIVRLYGQNNEELVNLITERAAELLGQGFRKKMPSWVDLIWSGLTNLFGKKIDLDAAISTDWYNMQTGRLAVIDFFERRYEPQFTLFDKNVMQTYDITPLIGDKKQPLGFDRAKLNNLREMRPNSDFSISETEKIYQISFCPALMVKLYDAPSAVQDGRFKYNLFLWDDFHPDIEKSRAIVDDLMDINKNINRRMNMFDTFLNRIAHGGGHIYESSAKVNGEFKTTIGGNLEVSDGTLTGGKIQPNSVANSAGVQFGQLFEQGIKERDELSGLNPASRGQQESAGESGDYFDSKVRQGEIMQSWELDNINSAGKYAIRKVISTTQKFMREEEMIRITEDGSDPTWIKINERTIYGIKNDITKGEYDVEIANAPMGIMAKEQEFKKLLQVNQILMQANPRYFNAKLLLKAAPIQSKGQMLEWVDKVDMEEQQLAQIQMQQAAQQQQAEGETRQIDNQSKSLDNEKLLQEIQMEQILRNAAGF